MAPPRWTTAEQYEFLTEYLPTFLDYTAKNKQPKFWALLNSAWFARWPEIDELITQKLLPTQASSQDRSDDEPQYKFTPAEQKLYKNALEARKNVSVVTQTLLLQVSYTTDLVVYTATSSVDAKRAKEAPWSWEHIKHTKDLCS